MCWCGKKFAEMKTSWRVFCGCDMYFLLCCVCCVFISAGSVTSDKSNIKSSKSSKSVAQRPEFPEFPEFSLVLKRLDALEKENQELKKSHKKLNEQFKQMKKKLGELKKVWFCASPRKGKKCPGKQTQKQKQGEESLLPAAQSLTSCSVAMEILPFLHPKPKQTIHPYGDRNTTSVEVLCDFETDGGGWTVIQKRSSGPEYDFDRNWTDYKTGFGSLDGNFWLGLDNIHALTKHGDQELQIELEDFEGNKTWAKYSSFSISDASDFYRLRISGFSISGNSSAGDSMYSNNRMRFSSKDKDNDNSEENCAANYGGGWWFNNCGRSWLNGLYREKGERKGNSGILWYSWKGLKSLAKTEMKIRKRKQKNI